MDKNLIVITGKAQVGKDTTATYLMHQLNNRNDVDDYLNIAFAKALKEDVMFNFDLSFEQVYGELKEAPDTRYAKSTDGEKIIYWTPREIMQYYGQAMRDIDYNIWIKRLFKEVDSSSNSNFIITDARHVNEIESSLRYSCTLIKVVREVEQKVHGTKHVSETALDEYEMSPDFIIDNNGSFDSLHKQLDTVISFIKEKEIKTWQVKKDLK